LTNKKWYFASYKVAGQTIPYENENGTCGRDYYEFQAGGTFINSYYSQCELFTSQRGWVLEGAKITVSLDGEVDSATIKNLTNTELELEIRVDFDDNGTEETIRVVLTSS
jgi:hypothetical protein